MSRKRPGLLAAGGILEKGSGGELRVALVHRRRYRDRDGSEGDWVLPKGKPDPGESIEATALREVAEETGCRARVDGEPIRCAYPVDGGTKVVHFFPMRCQAEGPVGDEKEVREVAWLSLPEAHARLTYDTERAVLEEAYPRLIPR